MLFADVVGSTSLVEQLEPESARRVLDRFFETMRSVVEGYGGTVEKFIGDAVMAVFGIPFVHEDDALRAVRAAVEMREVLERLNAELERSLGLHIEMRVGVATGEVVAGNPANAQSFVTGDAVNVAARLEATTEPGEIRIAESTYRLVRSAVIAERIGPVKLKGKAHAITVHRLRGLGADEHARRVESGFVGRREELDALGDAFEEASRDRTSLLVTVIGAAGVGKSRLVEEFLATRTEDATTIRGRCLPYGVGITYWPLKEAIGEASGLRGDESTDAARARIRALVEPAPDADLVSERIAETIGIAVAVPEHGGRVWAARRLFEELARLRPLIVVLDDIQWAETAFLELIEDVVRTTRDSPILVLCMARPELLEARLSWVSPAERASQVFLEPLTPNESESLLGNILDGGELEEESRTGIVAASNGLPLFVEELVAMLLEEGTLQRDNGRWIVSDLSRISAPPTIHALLAARLDQIGHAERAVLQRGSVEGQVFHRSAIAYLTAEPERIAVEALLSELVLKKLIEPESAGFLDDNAYRFHHLLLRDVAYESVQKDDRANLHERFAGWLEDRAGERASEYDEIVGYHLEQAHRYEAELRPTAVGVHLAERAATRLGDAGVRAHARGDWSAAASLLARAIELTSVRSELRAKLGPKLSEAQLEISPSRPGLLRRLRCFFRLPPGHSWTTRERAGGVVFRCTRCGREKRLRLTPKVVMPSDSLYGPGGNG